MGKSKPFEHYSTIRYDAAKHMEWEEKTVLFNDVEVKVKLSKTTEDYMISAPPEFMDYMKRLYKSGYAGLTMGQFIRKILGSL